MRASEVKAEIVTVVEAVSVDKSAGTRDRLVFIDTGGREIQGSPDRVFRLALQSVPRRVPLMTLDAYICDYGLDVHYVASKNVEDRIASDSERIINDLTSLYDEADDIYNIELTPGSVLELEGLLIAHTDCAVTYRLTGV